MFYSSSTGSLPLLCSRLSVFVFNSFFLSFFPPLWRYLFVIFVAFLFTLSACSLWAAHFTQMLLHNTIVYTIHQYLRFLDETWELNSLRFGEFSYTLFGLRWVYLFDCINMRQMFYLCFTRWCIRFMTKRRSHRVSLNMNVFVITHRRFSFSIER